MHKLRPQGEYKIDWTHPLTRGLEFCTVLGVGNVELVSNSMPDLDESEYTTLNGDECANFKLTKSLRYDEISTKKIQSGEHFTVSCGFSTGTTSDQGYLFSLALSPYSTTDDKCELYLSNYWEGLRLLYSNGGSGTRGVASTYDMRDGDRHSVSVLRNIDIGAQLYIDGIYDTAITNSLYSIFDFTSTQIGNSRAFTFPTKKGVHYLYRHNRLLTDDEIKSLDKDPYQFLIPVNTVGDDSLLASLFSVVTGNTPLSKLVNTKWNSNELLSKTINTKWNMNSIISKVINTKWNMNSIISKVINTKWNMNSIISKVINTKWNMNSIISKVINTKWNMNSIISKVINTKWNMNSIISKVINTKWNMNSLISKVINTKWNLLSSLTAIVKQVSIKWNSNATIAKTVNTKWNMNSLISKVINTRWNLNSLVGKVLNVKWNLLSSLVSIYKQINVKWNSNATIAKTVNTKWNMNSLISKVINTKWNLNSLVGKVLNVKWNLSDLVPVSKLLSAKWNSISRLSKQLNIRWNLGAFVLTTTNVITLRTKNKGHTLRRKAKKFSIRPKNKTYKYE